MTGKMSVEEYRLAKRVMEMEEKNKRLVQALETLGEVEWDEWEEDDMSATAFKFVLLSKAGLPDDEMDLESEAVKKLFPQGVPGIGEFIKEALDGREWNELPVVNF